MSEPPSEHPVPNGVSLHAPATVGERAADAVTRIIGSWRFILLQSSLLIVWAVLNLVAWSRHWDPYPFILMNLMLSLQAAYAGPIIMMSQNRMAEHDRRVAHKDYRTDSRAEREVRQIMAHLERQDVLLGEIRDRLREMAAPDRAHGREDARLSRDEGGA